MTFDLSLLTPATELGPEAPDDTILKPKDVIYEAESPDEAALGIDENYESHYIWLYTVFCIKQKVYTAKGYGVTLMKRDTESVLVQWPNQEQMKDYRVEGNRLST